MDPKIFYKARFHRFLPDLNEEFPGIIGSQTNSKQQKNSIFSQNVSFCQKVHKILQNTPFSGKNRKNDRKGRNFPKKKSGQTRTPKNWTPEVFYSDFDRSRRGVYEHFVERGAREMNTDQNQRNNIFSRFLRPKIKKH